MLFPFLNELEDDTESNAPESATFFYSCVRVGSEVGLEHMCKWSESMQINVDDEKSKVVRICKIHSKVEWSQPMMRNKMMSQMNKLGSLIRKHLKCKIIVGRLPPGFFKSGTRYRQ